MPLTKKGEKIRSALQAEYGKSKGKQILYAGKNSGRFTGIDAAEKGPCGMPKDQCRCGIDESPVRKRLHVALDRVMNALDSRK